MNEFQGAWVRRGLIHVPVPAGNVSESNLNPLERELADTRWTPETLRACHAAYIAGKRDIYTIAGHREWDRRRQAQKRSGRMSAEDMAWCEQQAEIGFWRLYEKVNRRGGNEALQRVAERKISASLSSVNE